MVVNLSLMREQVSYVLVTSDGAPAELCTLAASLLCARPRRRVLQRLHQLLSGVASLGRGYPPSHAIRLVAKATTAEPHQSRVSPQLTDDWLLPMGNTSGI